MDRYSRRGFFVRTGGLGLAAGVGGLVLPAGASPTASSGVLGAYGAFLSQNGEAVPTAKGDWKPTEDNILGPYYRKGAPFRGKITPPLSAGKVLVVRGRVWGHDTRKPLAGAVVDIWQADANGRYDNEDPRNPPAENVFVNRARMVADESGYYEYETVHPGRYQVGQGQWRPAHVHYMVVHPGYQTLVTQMYFAGDPMNRTDSFIKPSLIVKPADVKVEGGVYESATFDIVLARKG